MRTGRERAGSLRAYPRRAPTLRSPMRRFSSRLAAVLPLVAVALSGCFQMASLLTVRPDGSATVAETFTFSEQALSFMTMADTAGTGLADRAQLEARAAALGPGVRLLSVKTDKDSYTATYGVDRVADLRYTPPSPPSGDDGPGGRAEPDRAEAPYTFAFTPGAAGMPHTLVVTVPDTDPVQTADDPEPADPAQQQQALAMARALLGDARATIRVAVAGEIVETDAAFADGEAVTLADIQMGVLFDLLAEHPELMGAQDAPMGEIARLADGRDGLRVQVPGAVTVRFE